MYFEEKFTAGEMEEIAIIGAWSGEVLCGWTSAPTRPSQHPIHVVRRRRTWMKDEFARADEINRERAQRWAAEAPARARKRHANTKWRCTKSVDNRCTSTVAPLLAEPLCYTVSYRYVSDHLYLGRLPAGRGARSWRWMISRHGARSPARRVLCRRSRTT